MSAKIKSIIVYLLGFLFIFISSCNFNSDSQKLKAGNLAPDFTLRSIEGKEYTLSGFQGKVVFVNFWATWCPPCKQEIPSMVSFYNKLKGKGVEILAISEDTDINAVKKFIKKYKITFPVLIDENKKVYNLYKATGVPETHLINKSGMIENSIIGPFDWDTAGVIGAVNKLLQQ